MFRMPENAVCRLQMSQNRLVAGASPDPAGGAYSTPPDLLTGGEEYKPLLKTPPIISLSAIVSAYNKATK